MTDELRTAIEAALPDNAAILRRAASLLRERAGNATPGPWSCANEHELLGPEADPAWCISQMKPGYETMSPTDGYVGDLAGVWCDDRESCPDGDYIEMMHPPVALALADWLDDEAVRGLGRADNVAAYAVARAVLREAGEWGSDDR